MSKPVTVTIGEERLSLQPVKLLTRMQLIALAELLGIKIDHVGTSKALLSSVTKAGVEYTDVRRTRGFTAEWRVWAPPKPA